MSHVVIVMTGTGATTTASSYIPNTLTLEYGVYTVNTVNAHIQEFCIEKGIFLTDGSGNNVFYLSITPNSTTYANQIVTNLFLLLFLLDILHHLIFPVIL